MNVAPSLSRFIRRRRQHGSIIIFAALTISLVVIILSVTDIGFLYFYKREYQKAADLAALAGAKTLFSGCAAAQAAAAANAGGNLGSRSYTPTFECGVWNSSATPMFAAGGANPNAVRAIISGTPPKFFPVISSRTITASAVAITDQPIANLTIRTALASIDASKSAILNSVLGGLLGGSLSLDAVSWQGLANTNVNLLTYMDALAVRLGVAAGNYTQVLNTTTNVTTLLGAMVDALGGGSTAGAAVTSIIGGVGVTVGAINNLTLGSLLALQTGTPTTGLGLDLNALQLAQAFVQLANYNSAVTATVPLNLLGLASGNVYVKIIEPPQISATGNPELAKANPTGPNRIYVRDAQVRTLISLDLPIVGATLSTLQSLLNNPVVSGITNTVNSLLSLNLLDLLSGLSCLVYCDIQRDIVDIQVLPSPRVDVNLDAGSGQAYVTDCNCDNAKSLTVQATTSAAELRVGKMGTSAADAASKVFSSASPPTVDPVALIDIGTRRVRYQCTLLLICSTTWRTSSGTWTSNVALSQRNAFAGGGVGLKTDAPVAASSTTLTYAEPPTGGLPNLNQNPAWQSVSSTNIISSLSSTLTGIQLQIYPPSGGSIGTSGLGNLLTLVGSVVSTLVSTLSSVINGALSPLLDPLVNALLSSLGVNLAQTDVGARMTCDGGGATLVN